ncbi:substrate-binding domain-containing protein [Sinorhizobium meliloti]|uniref:sugar ABC transporter substrate-binding protein n=1 Tax=Rhizobium meliloti TaxID=382 RepID=UPI00398C8480
MKRILAAVALTFMVSSASAQEERTFYLISHGAESDPFWISWNAGAQSTCKQLRVTCNISFSNGDFAIQKEAFNAAIASAPDGIAVTSAQPGLWTQEVPLAQKNGIPVVFFNSDDPSTGRNAYVGADLKLAGSIWAQYLVDKGLVKAGDKVFLPVEVPGASYQQLETSGIAAVFDPLGIKYDVVDTGADPAGVIQRMSEYMIANDVDAMIGLGDLVMSNAQRVMENVNMAPGDIPVVGWGNSRETAMAVKAGYVAAALWQYPVDQGSLPVFLLNSAASGNPIGYDISTLQLYDIDTVGPILEQYK